MTKFQIEYNPYTVECNFIKNGKLLNSKSKIGAKSGVRLQVLLGEAVNWKGLAEEIVSACDDDEIELTFKGRVIDYEDLKYCIDHYTGETRFELRFDEAKNDADIIAELDNLFHEIKVKDLPEFKITNEDGKNIFDAYEEVKSGIFEVSVIATMSSGKSTLINSLLHTELLPSENKACTATIARILDNDEMDHYEAECYAKDEKTLIHSRAAVDPEMLKKYNGDPQIMYIDIEGNVPAISSDKIRLCLRDTPGPNNSRDENHGKLTNSIIKRTNAVVLYVMNATQFGIKDDRQLLLDISSEMKRAGKQSRDRFIFVVNKCDQLDEEKEPLDKLLEEVKNYLKQFGIDDPTVIPTSAQLALLIRKDRRGDKLSRQEKNTLSQVDDYVKNKLLHFEDYATLTPNVREKLRLQVEKYHSDEETWDYEALIHTGVPAVEETIIEYIDKYAYPMKIKDAIKDIVAILGELNMKARFDEVIAQDDEKLSMVRRQIADARERHEKSKQIYDDYKAKIDSLGLDSVIEDEEQFRIENTLNLMLKEYDGKEKVDKLVADSLIEEFQDNLGRYQEECESRLNREIDLHIFQKCSEMMDEYASVVRSILNDIEIEGYDFEKISSFERIKIKNINDITRRNEQDRVRKETRWKDNPERAGFWGKFKFWKPKQISYTVDVKEGIDVNVKNVIVDIMNIFSKNIKENISHMFEQSDAQIQEYKGAFKDNIEKLNTEIGKIIEQLDRDTSESALLQDKVEKNREMAKWVSEKEEKIRTILMF